MEGQQQLLCLATVLLPVIFSEQDGPKPYDDPGTGSGWDNHWGHGNQKYQRNQAGTSWG